MIDKIFTCEECEADFEIIHEGTEKVAYCPFCGELISQPSTDDDNSEEIEEDYD